MDDVLKYERIEGALQDIVEKESVTVVRLETDNIVLGTERGYLHVVNLSGELVKSAQVLARPITALSVEYDGDLVILR
ncbi:hypothetical protein B484DRAFT_391867 [Ochromonadaceae sp. CCMP2298]|nr:hypothetical protein B484DRAFT_391867 [Ochromonadaceae sp. CCMP2298]